MPYVLLWGWSESKNTQWMYAYSAVYFQINFPHEKTEQWPIFPHSHPEGSDILSRCVTSECMPSAQNSVLCEQNHCETASCTAASVCHLWPPRCFFRGPKRWKSLGAKTTIAWQMATLSQKFRWVCLKHPSYTPDLAPSDFNLFIPLKKHLEGRRCQNDVELQEAVSQRFCLQSSESVLKPFIHWHIVANAWTLRMTMWKSEPLFCFLLWNVVLNKRLLIEHIFTVHSYCLTNLHMLLLFE
jgi:hypothetical protein